MSDCFIQWHDELLTAADQELSLSWCWSDAEGKVTTTVITDTMAVLVEQLKAQPKAQTVLVLPSSRCTVTAVKVPSKQRKHIEQSVPFLLEEQLVEDVEDYHLTLLAVTEQQMVPVIAVNKAYLAQVLNYCQEQDFEPDRIVPASVLMAAEANQLVADTDQAVLRLPDWQFSMLKNQQLSLLLGTVISFEEELTGIYLGDSAIESLPSIPLLTWQQQTMPVLCWMAKNYGENAALKRINLRHGQFKLQQADNGVFQQWRWSIAAAMLAIALWGSGQYWQIKQLEKQATQYETAAVELYQKLFPNDTIVDVYDQFKAKLQGRRVDEGLGFLQALHKWGQAQAKLPGGQVTVKNIDFREQGRFSLEVNASSLDAVDKLLAAVKEQGLDAELKSANHSQEQVVARIVVKDLLVNPIAKREAG
ncbi:type II secretion system protein GspL [Spartinivicinus ruber]|uniref:type II secretion system protein GspL n=1 Tax=Spartinivicinus ruber TaxID=2683272 RepID=UPI0013D70327|nr:type II secretion system protein GspL [Spartinivicinus ruber]